MKGENENPNHTLKLKKSECHKSRTDDIIGSIIYSTQ